MPATKRDTDMSVAVAPTVADLLRQVWPQHTAKRAAAAGRRSHRTVQDWIQRRCCPSADDLFQMAAENDELRAVMIRALEGIAYAGLVADVAGAPGPASGGVVAQPGGADAAPHPGRQRGAVASGGRRA